MKTFALAGNPNSGKTTLFNALTGSTAHVGNWPGVTVDKKEGLYKGCDEKVTIVDLPGIYSLSPYTPEEVISRNFILEGNPDGIINIVDATNLERNLYLTTQLLEMDVPVIVALNMADEVEKEGDYIDVEALEKALGVPVVSISALKKTGIKLLMDRAVAMPKRQGVSVIADKMGDRLQTLVDWYKEDGVSSPLFHALKLLEKDEIELQRKCADCELSSLAITEDMEAIIADERYKYITSNYSPCKKKAKKGGLTKSDKADKVLTHKVWAIPLFLVIMFAIFHLTFTENLFFLGGILPASSLDGDSVGGIIAGLFYNLEEGAIYGPGVIITNILNLLLDYIGGGVSSLIALCGGSALAESLVVDAVLGGIFSVLGFLPQILFLFLCFSILEDTGYMARIAFVLDKLFRKFGLSGRAFLPMIMGFGCSVPAFINTRTLADEKERTATIRVIPFFSCGAKLPILTAMSGAILSVFGVGNADVITYAMYVLGVAIAIVSVLLMRNTTLKGETPPFVMELPTYRMPGFVNLMLHLWDKAKHFIQKAFTIIFASTVIIWFLQSFSWDWKFLLQDAQELFQADPVKWASLEGVEGLINVQTDKSILGSIGMLIQPLFTPLGFGSQLAHFGWVFAVAAITGLVAKENVVATFGALAAVCAGAYVDWEADEVAAAVAMVSATGITIPAILAFIVFNMTTIPCFAAVATAKAEVRKGQFKWTVLFWVVASYVASCAVYTIGSWWWTSFIWLAVASLVTAGIVLYNKGVLKFKKSK